MMHQLQKKIQIITILLLSSLGAMAQAEFITTWNTTNFGNSSNSSIRIQVIGNYDIDVGNDGTYDLFDRTTGITTVDVTAFGYPAGEIQIAIRNPISGVGNLQGIMTFDDRQKLLSIDQWGSSIAWTTMNSAFRGCENLDVPATDAPNLSGVSSLNNMFEGCTSLVGTPVFSNWDVSSVTSLSRTFFGTPLFDHYLGDWDLANVGNASGFLSGSGLSLSNWDATILAWAAQGIPGGSPAPLGAAGLEYCAASAERFALNSQGILIIVGDTQGCPPITCNATADNYQEAVANDGSIAPNANPLIYNITGDTFADANNDDIIELGDGFTIPNLPAGLTARFILSNSDTTATLQLSGNAINNNSTDTVGLLRIEFDAGIRTSGVPPTVICDTRVGVFFTDPLIVCNSTTTASNYEEAAANDGSIAPNANPLVYTLTGDTFRDTNNDGFLDGGFDVTNLPTGLTARFRLSNSDTTATLELTGNAVNNTSANNIGVLNIVRSFTSLTTSGIRPTLTCTNAVGINFIDPVIGISCNPTADDYQEVVATNNGSIATNANPLVYNITGGTFIDTNNDDILDAGFSISNLPSGLTARFILS
ncbi:BspA family leucine-rich repeat surface protein, partial [Flavivirga amylovorans]